MPELDVLFVVDALPETGFGHAARCASIARLLRRNRSQIRIGFQGLFSDAALKLVSGPLDEIEFFKPEMDMRTGVAVIDRMRDIEDADSWDPVLLERLLGFSNDVIHLTSGTKAANFPDGVTCIGFQLGGPSPCLPNLLWGLEYAPVSMSLASPNKMQAQERNRLLIALGGARDTRAIELVMGALEHLPMVAHIDVLGSPVNDPSLLDAARCDGREIKLHVSVPDITPLLQSARVVLASYGHLVYEALAWGTAVCVVGQKQFQFEYGRQLADMGLVINGGYVPDIDAASLAMALEQTWNEADTLSKLGTKAVDGRGLDRIADILLEKLD